MFELKKIYWKELIISDFKTKGFDQCINEKLGLTTSVLTFDLCGKWLKIGKYFVTTLKVRFYDLTIIQLKIQRLALWWILNFSIFGKNRNWFSPDFSPEIARWVAFPLDSKSLGSENSRWERNNGPFFASIFSQE